MCNPARSQQEPVLGLRAPAVFVVVVVEVVWMLRWLWLLLRFRPRRDHRHRYSPHSLLASPPTSPSPLAPVDPAGVVLVVVVLEVPLTWQRLMIWWLLWLLLRPHPGCKSPHKLLVPPPHPPHLWRWCLVVAVGGHQPGWWGSVVLRLIVVPPPHPHPPHLWRWCLVATVVVVETSHHQAKGCLVAAMVVV